jgi:glycosyltransferase involved in cell wall biosynthesis
VGSETLRIAQVCPKYYPEIGGVETHVKEISERLVKKGHEVEVICTESSGNLRKHDVINGVKVTRFCSIAYRNAFYFSPQIYFYMRSHLYDGVHIHNYHAFPAFFAALACKGFIFTPHYHGGSYFKVRNLLHMPYRMPGVFIFRRASKVITVSQFEKELLKKHFKIGNQKFLSIPNGLNMEEFRNISPGKTENKTILYVGRLEKYKGVHHIISALPMLEEYRLEIIGSGPYEKDLNILAEKLRLNDRIDWLSGLGRAELLSHYKSAAVLVNLSRFESYGITIAEALACGTPCIVAKGSALEDFIDGEGCVGINYPIDKRTLVSSIRSKKKIKPREMRDWNDITVELIEVYTSNRINP